jgi:hypothetical protein
MPEIDDYISVFLNTAVLYSSSAVSVCHYPDKVIQVSLYTYAGYSFSVAECAEQSCYSE